MLAAEFNWQVPIDHPALAGHFPGSPIVPGVVLLDRAIRFAEQLTSRTRSDWQIGHAKFFSPARPGDLLTFALQEKGGGAIAFTIRAAGREVAAGSLTTLAP